MTANYVLVNSGFDAKGCLYLYRIGQCGFEDHRCTHINLPEAMIEPLLGKNTSITVATYTWSIAGYHITPALEAKLYQLITKRARRVLKGEGRLEHPLLEVANQQRYDRNCRFLIQALRS